VKAGSPILRFEPAINHRRLTWLCVAAGMLCLLALVFGHVGLATTLFFLPMVGLNSPTIKGDTTVIWGTGGVTVTTVTGYLTSVRDGLTGEMVEVADNNGFTVAVVLFNHKDECELQLIVQTSFPTLTRGTVITVGSLTNVVVTDVEKMWEQKGVAKYTVKGTAWSGMPSP
jgi:hypothetical protein